MEQSGLNPRNTDNRSGHTDSFRNISVSSTQSGSHRMCVVHFHTQNRPLNILTFEFMQEFAEFLESKEAALAHTIVFTSQKPGVFLAGADIPMIYAIRKEEDAREKAQVGKEMFYGLRKLKAKTVAWVNGSCLGGGCELALFCDLIVMEQNPNARIGLPETKLGIIPGFGGTVLLPRRIGPRRALKLILKGKSLDPQAAYRVGLVDALVPEGLKVSPKVVGELLAHKRKRKGWLLAKALRSSLTPLAVYVARKSIERKTQNYPALRAACDVVQKTYFLPETKAFVVESDAFASVAVTQTSKNLIKVFFLSEAAKRLGRKAKDAESFSSMGIVGGGVMGAGIAVCGSKAGLNIRCKDLTTDVLERSLKATRQNHKKAWPTWHEYLQRYLRVQDDYFGFSSLDCVVEAVFEDLALKRKIFSDLEDVVRSDCLLVSNTSSIPLSEIGSELKDPSRFAGLHFFSPVLRMPLVEVVKAKHTSEETINRLCALVVKMGKLPLVCQDTSGFVVNRILAFYLNEGIHLLADGVIPSRIERLAKGFGFPMGPLRLLDEVGIDVAVRVMGILDQRHGGRYCPRPGLEKMLAEGRLGRKSGSGFYKYEAGTAMSLDEVYCSRLRTMLEPSETIAGISDEDVADRLVLPMVAEGCRLVEEKVVSSVDAVDTGTVFGAGFPPFRGGVMAYARSIGVTYVEERLQTFSEQGIFPKRFHLDFGKEVLHLL